MNDTQYEVRMRSEVKRLRIIEHIAARLIAYQEAGEPHFSAARVLTPSRLGYWWGWRRGSWREP